MKNALIAIGVQNDYSPGGAYPLEGAADAAAEIVVAVRQAYKEGWRSCFAAQASPISG
ncbi:hypothetical protein [Pseudescherichia sp.]|uniref:hypothetical protein n=1 Tax=Pseudescherichia sp. TaxID=2055881 RepID=UPI0028A2BF3A|nr:hypothetical protein [Pseudescherichia sp.]